LIDLSPPGSPTFTTRSSSDGVSVDSFGSDGNSNPSAFTSSGNTSQTESAFEDDFDFFGLSAKKMAQNDPWQTKTIVQDPFGPLEDACSNMSQSAGGASLFSLSSNNRVTNQVPSNLITSKSLVTSMPTIIRARPPKPPAPKLPASKKLEPIATAAFTDFKALSSNVAAKKQLTLDFSSAWSNNFEESNDSPSPPMPTIPPPAPPPNYLAELNNDLQVNIENRVSYITYFNDICNISLTYRYI
jgi:hypothetical protein